MTEQIPERYKVEYRDCTQANIVVSETWEWDRMRLLAMADFAKRLIEELGQAETERDQLRQALIDSETECQMQTAHKDELRLEVARLLERARNGLDVQLARKDALLSAAVIARNRASTDKNYHARRMGLELEQEYRALALDKEQNDNET